MTPFFHLLRLVDSNLNSFCPFIVVPRLVLGSQPGMGILKDILRILPTTVRTYKEQEIYFLWESQPQKLCQYLIPLQHKTRIFSTLLENLLWHTDFCMIWPTLPLTSPSLSSPGYFSPVQTLKTRVLSVLPVYQVCSYPWLCICYSLCLELFLSPKFTWLSPYPPWSHDSNITFSMRVILIILFTISNTTHRIYFLFFVPASPPFTLAIINYKSVSYLLNKLYKGRNFCLSCSLVYSST